MKTKYNIDTLVNLLKQSDLFSKVPVSLLLRLCKQMVIDHYEKSKTIITKKATGDCMYLVLDGSVFVHEGQFSIAKLEQGEVFGELSILDNKPRSMSVKTAIKTTIGRIDRNSFYEVLAGFPDITQDIIRILSKRLRVQDEFAIKELREREKELQAQVIQRTKELENKNMLLAFALENQKKQEQQLIYQEKLASLGQLISGISHELQNPLNFVINFSEISIELFDDIDKSKNEKERKEIIDNLHQNLEKIHYHGKRAENIIRNMLEYNAKGAGEKTKTDINTLCEEYLNLAYYGVKMRNKNFECEVIKNLDPKLPFIKTTPRELSHVVLNVLNNAFYAVADENKKNKASFQPLVTIKTEIKNNNLIISISDNGPGINKKVAENIFTPFFTTKPSGQGIGLGLSICYEIIKSQNGSINYTPNKPKGSVFIISIPAIK